MRDTTDYFSGMFQYDQRDKPSPFEAIHDLEKACHHEAAHAVVEYAFGYLLEHIGVCASYDVNAEGERVVGHGGLVRRRSRSGRDSVVIDYDYRPSLFRLGVIFAAGPAGERRHCMEREAPIRMLGASEGDHLGIDGIAKMLERRGRDRYAYRRLVWHAAKRIVAMPDVWNAICDVAADIYDVACEVECEDEPPMRGDVWFRIKPQDVYRACRRNRVTRGMLLASEEAKFEPIFPTTSPVARAA